MKDEKKNSFCVGRKTHRGKISWPISKRNAIEYEQIVWHVTSTNATVLADNVKSLVKEVEGRS